MIFIKKAVIGFQTLKVKPNMRETKFYLVYLFFVSAIITY